MRGSAGDIQPATKIAKGIIQTANFADGQYDKALEKFAETAIIPGASEDGLRIKIVVSI